MANDSTASDATTAQERGQWAPAGHNHRRRQSPFGHKQAPAIVDNLPASLPITMAELEAIERFVPDLGAFLDAPSTTSPLSPLDTDGVTACSRPIHEASARP